MQVLKAGRDLDIAVALEVMDYIWITHWLRFSAELAAKWIGTVKEVEESGGEVEQEGERREAGVNAKALAGRLGHLIPDGAEEDALARGERQAEAAADLRQDCREDDDEVKAAEPVEDAVPEDEAPHHVAARVVEARDARRRDGRHALEKGIDGIH